MKHRYNLKESYLYTAEVLIIVLLACVPLFATFPYRVNIFLSWEGAYRISQGELPFRDFGTPLGGMYWVIPGIFFKIFGAQMITLVKAQVFINILSGLAFRSILRSCGVRTGIRFSAVLLYCISFSFFNFWPWYNHTVIVYEFIGLAFLFKGITTSNKKVSAGWLVLAALFTVFSFLTKQDAGALALLLCLALVGYHCLQSRRWLPIIIYAGSVALIFLLIIAPFLKHDFGYWFNHGQAPHSARISLVEIVTEFFSSSQWIKFYLFIIAVILIIRYKSLRELWVQKNEMLFLLLTVGILVQAAIFQVTSYTPPDNNIFFHSFAIAYILSLLAGMLPVNVNKPAVIASFSAGILLWWSSVYWKYMQRIIQRTLPQQESNISATGENVVNRKTFTIHPVDSTAEEMAEATWTFSGLKSFNKIYMPRPTVAGIKRLLELDIIKNNNGNLRVLNMSELTPLAAEIPFKLEKGSHYPLWYHLGVGMFNKQAEMFEKKIAAKEYDLVLFEYIPVLNNFYPFRTRGFLQTHYQKIDSFPAPRRGDTQGMIEVYTK
jgi:hypothetical protein